MSNSCEKCKDWRKIYDIMLDSLSRKTILISSLEKEIAELKERMGKIVQEIDSWDE